MYVHIFIICYFISTINKANQLNASSLLAYQFDRLIIDLHKILAERELFNTECDAMETQLSCYVHPSQLHIHGNQLHSTHSSGEKIP